MPKPNDLDWDTWLKPAPRRPWSPHRYHEWRNYRDYSGGIATDLFVHRMTRLIRSLGLAYPKRASGLGGIYMWPDGRDLPDNLEVLLEYPAIDGITPGMTVRLLGTMANRYRSPHVIRGHQATMIFNNDGWEIIDFIEHGQTAVVQTFKKTGGERVDLHHKNHHAAIRENTPLNCPPELGLYGVAAVVMGNESWFKHQTIEWDNQNQKMRTIASDV